MNDCIFCKIINGELPCVKVYEDIEIMAFLDIHPVNFGHTLIVPKAHYINISDTPTDLLGKLMVVTQKIAPAILKATGTSSFNLGVNNGAPAGQVIFHTHFHVMPRYEGDGYKMWGSRAYAPGEMEKLGEAVKAAI
ncbi:MAG: HIT family protein [Candidatus Magasanikbacteria bacterium]|nr:HIT family protein [Candidatus Magasanikbacteria bacterium]